MPAPTPLGPALSHAEGPARFQRQYKPLTVAAGLTAGRGLKPLLAHAAAAWGIPLDDRQLAAFARYRAALLERNQRVNLTGVRDPDEQERRLFVESLALATLLPGDVATLADVGSGAGFPGLALAIALPHLRVALIEATLKKCRFLEEVAGELGLGGRAQVLPRRAEEVGRDAAHRERYDVVAARAVAPLPTLLELCAPLCRVGGLVLAPKGARAEEEIAASANACARLGLAAPGLRAVGLPGCGGATRVVVVRKEAATPPGYPRRVGLPAQRPLLGRAAVG